MLTYKTVDDLLAGPLDEILTRLDSLGVKDCPETARAVLGGIEVPTLRLSELPDEIECIMADAIKNKNPRQRRVWKNQLKRAVANLQLALAEKLGTAKADIPVLELT